MKPPYWIVAKNGRNWRVLEFNRTGQARAFFRKNKEWKKHSSHDTREEAESEVVWQLQHPEE